MNIAVVNIYGDVYANDRLFDVRSCKIGENLLVPGIQLKETLEKCGHSFHTVDVYEDLTKIDYIIFSDLYNWYINACMTGKDYLKYVVRRKWRGDTLKKVMKVIPKKRRFLIIQEPPVYAKESYNKKAHGYFNKILTWDDRLVDNKKYFKFNYPQPVPETLYDVPYSGKKFLTMICGNKSSKGKNELYSSRRAVIDYFETNGHQFDLYGFGWEKSGLGNYRGTVKHKLQVLSRYKFCICFENMYGMHGYITEKIFDCFFAGCVPVYWGAENIEAYIPKEAFIDWRKFRGIEDVVNYLDHMSESEYEKYIASAREYLSGKAFQDDFSVDAYVGRIRKLLEIR